jgi:hypothetical protein
LSSAGSTGARRAAGADATGADATGADTTGADATGADTTGADAAGAWRTTESRTRSAAASAVVFVDRSFFTRRYGTAHDGNERAEHAEPEVTTAPHGQDVGH